MEYFEQRYDQLIRQDYVTMAIVVSGSLVFDSLAYLLVIGGGRWPSILLPLSAGVGIISVLMYVWIRHMPIFRGRIGVLWGLGILLIMSTLLITLYWDGLNLSFWIVIAWLYRKAWSPYHHVQRWAGIGWLGHAALQLLIRPSLTGWAVPWGLYLSGIGLGLIGTILFYLGSLIPPIRR
ncbi:hypothetical protein TPY_3169 [Sulfobacillus acidophilus TPY]|uniref:Uncharacterized protein n=1 Tax=Sulfobacillus acidophilus (strain ATCC 700253 / DSM 10332 / NAL) TaxID=679936 RepID=G8U137_SULAD|nr:hypothetical protein TPY_3169 [Sulfobacillus acidophilus TPY]AEW04270.1 hypothetical protein Sulac_0765 [Sulfobacillus acidophilus DSM 10332]